MNDRIPPQRGDITLVSILNVLWRRRLIVLGLPLLGLVVGLLYGMLGTRRWAATATVRPGITSFDPQGGAHRGWQLKDITRWYDTMMYRRELVKRLGLPPSARPVIRAEFVAQGLQNLQGGDVITLWTTATSPELAAAIIDTSMAVFHDYAEADTVSSQLKLTRDGLRLQVAHLGAQLTALPKQEASIGLRLEQARAESLAVLGEDRTFGLSLDEQAAGRAYYERRLADLQEQEPRLEADLQDLERLVRLTSEHGGKTVPADDLPGWVRRDAVLDGGDVLESLANAKLRVQRALGENRAQQDSMAYRAEMASIASSRLTIERETKVRQRLRAVSRTIGELVLERDYDLPQRHFDLHNEIAQRQMKLGLLAPLQRVGDTVVSDEPVRPRTMRATAILVFLGIIGGLVLAFVWDFLAAHRREIVRS